MNTINSFDAHKYEYSVLRSHSPELGYKEGRDIAVWRREVKERLTELLGLPLPEGKGALELEYEKDKDDHTEYRFTVETEPGYRIPCHLLIPSGIKGKVPLTVCLSGHGSGMHIALGVAKNEKDEKSLREWHHRAMGPRSLREGRAALIIESRHFGETSVEGIGTSCTEAAKLAILVGRTLIGERVSDAMRVLDAVLDRFDLLDTRGIVCTGNSGGGTATYYLACLDERIEYAAPSCAVCGYEDSIAAMPHCLCNHVPSIRKYFEMSDLSVLIAPRRLIIAAERLDPIFPIEGTKKTFAEIKRIYEASGAPDNCSLLVGESGHYNYADLIWEELHRIGV